jgi:catechol 2,3-dioxygenase-like lactoylglutathione lyase family enzyme
MLLEHATIAEGNTMTTETSLVTGTDFITIATKDFDAAVDFYGSVLGLPESKRWGSKPAAEFETGSLTIAVMQSDAFGLDFRANNHPIALRVDDVEAARAELESRGVSFGAETIDSGVCHMAYFSDPDGNALMLHHRYAPPGERPQAAA